MNELVSIDECFAMMDCMNSSANFEIGNRYLGSQSVDIFSSKYHLQYLGNQNILWNISVGGNPIILHIIIKNAENDQQTKLGFFVHGLNSDLQSSEVKKHCEGKAVSVKTSFVHNNPLRMIHIYDIVFAPFIRQEINVDKNLWLVASCILSIKEQTLR